MRKMKTNRKASKLDKLKARVAVLETEVKELDEALEADQLDQEKPETKVTFRHLPCLRYLGADHGTVGELPESHSRPGHVAHSYFTYSNRDWARPPLANHTGCCVCLRSLFCCSCSPAPNARNEIPKVDSNSGSVDISSSGSIERRKSDCYEVTWGMGPFGVEGLRLGLHSQLHTGCRMCPNTTNQARRAFFNLLRTSVPKPDKRPHNP
jgi:hypothetical protein